MKDKLAVLGGTKTIVTPLETYNSYGPEEVAAASSVVKSGMLSRFVGAWHENFYGGPKVREFEEAWASFFSVRHAISVNSATSGLIAAIGAIGAEPGDEIIVSPWTMSASATAILVWNAIPVFADIEQDTFNLDVNSIREKITKNTRAIVVPDIFGHPAELGAIVALARERGLKVIEDAAQAPAARYRDGYAGTIGDIGVFSLNYHKHIHTGEGGMCVTNDPALAERMQLIRNHAEAVVGPKGTADLNNMIGFNFRLGEVEAAMGIAQLKKLERLAADRVRVGRQLTDGLVGLTGLTTPVIKTACSHVYYVYGMTLDIAAIGVPRTRLVEALSAEGVPGLINGYTNVHLLPIYQKRLAFGSKGYPWKHADDSLSVNYAKGICPIAENLHDTRMMGLLTCSCQFSEQEVNLVIKAFHKVWNQLSLL